MILPFYGRLEESRELEQFKLNTTGSDGSHLGYVWRMEKK
jgi:hypothetical protein